MTEISLLFPHQLFDPHPVLIKDRDVYLIEEYLFFRQYKFHKQKIAYHRATMRTFAAHISKKHQVSYIDSSDRRSDVRELIEALGNNGIKTIHYVDPTDDWLSRRIKSKARERQIRLVSYPSPLFLNNKEEINEYFPDDTVHYAQAQFYQHQRKRLDILMEGKKPQGGKWSYDADNRKKYPRNKVPPITQFPDSTTAYEEACAYVEQNFSENPGSLSATPLYPLDHESAQDWLQQFLDKRFSEFGPYEDAIVAEASILHHSVLTPMLNIGLISPSQIIDRILEFAEINEIPLNSTEGFVRQIIGWREFIRAIYELQGRKERTCNYWKFTRKIPPSFYDGTTGIPPLDITIKKVLKTGYCHHIERLMVLGSFMLLCEFDPDEVYRWFMELFIDAYDWVMVPNVYGMSQFADGGLMSTKPYISGSNYLMKMSNFDKGPWQQIWDGLFWRFMHVQREYFLQNPRLGMLVRMFDKMPAEKQETHLKHAKNYLSLLDNA